jgi:hypothetical protein
MISKKLLAVIAAISLALSSGCIQLPKAPSDSNCQPQHDAAEGEVVRVKAPPQKIVIEQAACPPAGESAKTTTPEKKESSPESAKQPQRESSPRRPEAEAGQPEFGLGTLAALGQVASMTRTTAVTRPITSVNPGGSALGLGITWIHIPIPLPRIFCVDETPSVTVPLTEANLVAPGFGGDVHAPGGQQLSRRELSALVAQELAAQRCPAPRNDASSAPAQNDDAERRRLEKKLADAEAQIEKMSKVLQSLDDKLGPLSSPQKKPE